MIDRQPSLVASDGEIFDRVCFDGETATAISNRTNERVTFWVDLEAREAIEIERRPAGLSPRSSLRAVK